MSYERRCDERKTLSLGVCLKSSSGKREARISDISTSGCFVDTLVAQSPGESVSIKLLLPGGHWMALSGKVVYHYPQIGFGVRFMQLSDEQKNLLELLMECVYEMPRVYCSPHAQ